MQTFYSTVRRASFSFLSHLTRQKPRFAAPTSSIGSYPFPLSACYLKPCNRNSVTIHSRQFQSNPSRITESLLEKGRQEGAHIFKRLNLQMLESIESTYNDEEMMHAIDGIQFCSQRDQLLLPALALARMLDREGENPEKIISLATGALNALDTDDNKPSILVAMTLQLMGSANYYLKRFDDCLEYLNRANEIICRLEGEKGLCLIEDVRRVLHDVQFGLANVKTAMGRREEALCNLKKCLEIKETMLEENSKQLGVANRDLAEAYVTVFKFNEALPYALKASQIHTNGLGPNSAEVAHDHRVLGVIYAGLEDQKKAFFDAPLQHNQSSQNVLKKWGLSSDHLLRAEIDSANMHIAFGRYQEAMNTLKIVVHQTAKDSENRALTFISMGKSLCNQEKFVDSKRCFEIACEILVTKEKVSPVEVAEAYSEVSLQYEYMEELETAILLLKRTLAILEKMPRERHFEGKVSAKLGLLLLQTGEAESALLYLESASTKLKQSLGYKHFSTGYIFNYMAVAYLKLGRLVEAEDMFAVAKHCLEDSLGAYHADAIDLCQDLNKLDDRMKSYERVVDLFEGRGGLATTRHKILEQRAMENLCNNRSSDNNEPLPEQ